MTEQTAHVVFESDRLADTLVLKGVTSRITEGAEVVIDIEEDSLITAIIDALTAEKRRRNQAELRQHIKKLRAKEELVLEERRHYAREHAQAEQRLRAVRTEARQAERLLNESEEA